MNSILFQSLILLLSILFQLLISPYFQILGLKINWVLLVLIHFSLRPAQRQIPFLAMLSGLCCDALSHGTIGIYGISFILMVLWGQWLSAWFYSNSTVFTIFAVFIISLFEGSLGLTLIKLLEPDVSWSWIWYRKILPASLLLALAAPMVFRLITLMEKLVNSVRA